MAVYLHANDDVNHVITFAQTEKHIYGSSRLGINNKQVSMFGSQNATYSMRSIAHFIGKRTYELSNHLGNVLSVISDKVIPHNNGGTVDYWLADIRQSTDYSPFGVILKNRDLPLTSGTGNVPYRYSFQGQERDDEIKGAGNSLNYEYRMQDPRLGRFFAIDPLASKYPHNSPYAFSENRVIDGVELEGCEYISIHVRIKNDGSMERIKVVDHRDLMTDERVMEVHGMTKDKFYEEHSQTYEAKGPGVLYIYYKVDVNGDDYQIGDHMEMDRSIAEYGLYQGAGCVSLFGGNDADNPYCGPENFVPDYSFSPNDFQDFNAKQHDLDQEIHYPNVKNHTDPKTLPTDERFMQNVMRDKQSASNKNWNDPWTGRPASSDAIQAARRAILYFNLREMPSKQRANGVPVREIPIYDDGVNDANDNVIPENVG